ncbi:MAG: SIMPL domain-containing protein [Marinobacterium sp.]|jgi:hypothetical protein
MLTTNRSSALILGVFLLLGLSALGGLLGKAALDHKQLDRTVTVKGLSEREYQADIVIWPIPFAVASNDLDSLYTDLEVNAAQIRDFLTENGIQPDEISYAPPVITDRSAQQYGGDNRAEFRYVASRMVTVYSENIEGVRAVMNELPELGKRGIVLTGGDYQSQTEYIFSRLNEVKPEMIEEATRNAREVAQKFAADSQSRLGKIRRASQGQFSISERDRNNPHIKQVRVVSTVEYYLSD